MVQILSVTLKNFKTHRDRHFQFQVGTNAICGENGAGKTSIIEAIAWTLFNYQGDYTKEDLIHNGDGSAQATVTFVSSRDQRTYEVQRCTNRGYILYDPQLNQRLPYTRIKDEVTPWLRQHLGVAPNTDLGQVFAKTVGVPQGTFTADFLQTAENRKAVFDSVLKVEEYKAVHKQTNALRRYAEAKVEELERDVARYEEALQNWEDLQHRRLVMVQEIEQSEQALKQLQSALAQLQTEREGCLAQARQVQQRQAALQTLTVQIEAKQQTHSFLEQSLQRANQAVDVCDAQLQPYQAFLAAEEALQLLDQQNQQHQALLKQRQKSQKKLETHQADLTRLTLQLEIFAQADLEIQSLQSGVRQQDVLEAQQAEIAKQQQVLRQVELERQGVQDRVSSLTEEIEQLGNEIQYLKKLASMIQQIPEWEQRRDRLQEQLSRIEAAKQFEADLQQLVSQSQEKGDRYQVQAEAALQTLTDLQQTLLQQSPPLLATAVDSARSAISAGVTLNQETVTAVTEILQDLAEQVSAPKLQKQLKEIRQTLKQAYQQRAEFVALPTKEANQQALIEQQQRLQMKLTELGEQLKAEASLQTQSAQLAEAIAALKDPRGRSRLLARTLKQRDAVQADYETRQQVQAKIQQELAELDSQIEAFADLTVKISAQNQLRQANQSGYLSYLQNQKDAQTQPGLQAKLTAEIAELELLKTQQTERQQAYEQLAKSFDPQRLQQLESTYGETKSQADRISGSLPQQSKLLQELDQQLAVLKTTAEKRDQVKLDLKQRERTKRFINFARKVFKEAGPRITERYVQSISREADRLFRELLNRQNVALTWTKNYEILVQEGAHSRRFINLSGGEQMCAALAVRLALLKILADIDIAFFDEPTTNMDRPRRDSLAEAIGRIKSFSQLFVISHDDTFEKVTENVILVERES
ncbi:MAG: SMC family ATPase [Leptolyngbyaceae cyanobacterium MO_188.B28]|nr:SMC family ATPase [Leptolyngbyaceae cyanobacterium MO_188.B28]